MMKSKCHIDSKKKPKNLERNIFNIGLRSCLKGNLCKNKNCSYFHPNKACRNGKFCNHELCGFYHNTRRGHSHSHPLSCDDCIEKGFFFSIQSDDLKSMKNFTVLEEKEVDMINILCDLYPIEYANFYLIEIEDFEKILSFSDCENIFILPDKKAMAVTKLFMNDFYDLQCLQNKKINKIPNLPYESKLYIYPNSKFCTKFKCKEFYFFNRDTLRVLNMFLTEEIDRLSKFNYPANGDNVGCILPNISQQDILGLVCCSIRLDITMFKILLYLININSIGI